VRLALASAVMVFASAASAEVGKDLVAKLAAPAAQSEAGGQRPGKKAKVGEEEGRGREHEHRTPRAELPPLVDVIARIPDAIADLRYAAADNFMKRAVYPANARCLLRPATAEKLARVAARLRREDGTRLLLYDCYRPHSVQRLMWGVVPIRGYVAPPKTGSVHNRGAAVDLGLASRDGEPLPMPTDFDEFSRRAWHAYDGATPEEKRNRKRLRDAMLAEGFQPIRMEWWHYEDPDERGSPLQDVPFDAALP